MSVWVVMLFATLPGAAPKERLGDERVDLIEVNHYYDENGAHLLDQVLFYEWSESDARYQIRSWRLLKSPQQFPQPVAGGEGYLTTWREGAVVRTVQAPKMRETWTQYDPELLERRNLPREERRELFSPDRR